MNATFPEETTYVMSERFDRALKRLRAALGEMDLEIVGEFDAAQVWGESAGATSHATILLVDSPILLFEATALDRASAVFLPLHIAVAGNGDETRISMVNTPELYDTRLPAGAAGPISRLQRRVTLALESLVKPAERKSCITGGEW